MLMRAMYVVIKLSELAANPELRRALEESKREVDPSYGGQQSAGMVKAVKHVLCSLIV